MTTEALFLLRLIREKISRKVNPPIIIFLLLYIVFFLYATLCNLWDALDAIFNIYIIGLKKVTSDMQTHKNSALRAGPAPFKAPTINAALMKTVLPANAPIDKPPVFTRDGKKWLVVRYFANKNI